jgi:hypothetical protein
MNAGMKKLIIVGLLAISSLAANAATMKTSKATPLTTPQMESIKGAGTITVYHWQGTYWNGYQYVNWEYVVAGMYDTGPYGPNGAYYDGGPRAGMYYY